MDNEKLKKGKELSEKISKVREEIHGLDGAFNNGIKFRFVSHSSNALMCSTTIEDVELTKMIAAIIRAKLSIKLTELEEEFERL